MTKIKIFLEKKPTDLEYEINQFIVQTNCVVISCSLSEQGNWYTALLTYKDNNG